VQAQAVAFAALLQLGCGERKFGARCNLGARASSSKLARSPPLLATPKDHEPPPAIADI